MKTFFSACAPHYSSYTFPYGYYAVAEGNEDLSEIYENGFLPYTGDLQLDYPVFYKARSLRIALDKFSDSSENRRIARKFEGLELSIDKLDADFSKNHAFYKFAINYARERFKGGEMDFARLDYVLSRPYLTQVYRFFLDKKNVGYLLAIENDSVFHYWFCFFDLEMASDLPLGKYLMLQSIHLAKEKGCDYVYLGTCYGKRSLYKVRDFKGVEYHDGNSWSADVTTLKQLCKLDDEPLVGFSGDELKNAVNSNEYIQSILATKK
ncbi:MAG: GNAT family N-acetyltransferase [Saprospirales bacterium]|nr:MAG: GNAT family N-acetyltransferase [Saprospirales bacterium]